jgi:hypothetical protein
MMTDIKYKEAGKKIVRLYHKKRAEMTRSILYLYPTDIIKDEPNFKT